MSLSAQPGHGFFLAGASVEENEKTKITDVDRN